MYLRLNKKESLSFLARELPIQCGFSDESLLDTCLSQIRESLLQAVEKLGYEYVRYSYWIKDVMEGQEGQSETNSFSVNISNFPSSWEILYNKESLYLFDPVVRIIQENIATKHLIYGTWSDAYERALQNPLGETSEQKENYIKSVMQLITHSHQHHLMSGYYYSWGDNHRQIVLSLAAAEIDINVEPDDTFVNILHSIVVLVNQSILMTKGCMHCNKSVRIDGSDAVRLSRAELQILRLYSSHRNASQKQIAIHYNRSLDTVNHHLRSIRQKFKLPGASGHALASYAVELNLL